MWNPHVSGISGLSFKLEFLSSVHGSLSLVPDRTVVKILFSTSL